MSATTLEAIRQDKGTDKGTQEEDVKKAPAKQSSVSRLFKKAEEDDEKVLKWRFLAKGPALEAILKVFGAKAVQGDKQVSFVVEIPERGDVELGDVVRHIFTLAAQAGVTLSDIGDLIEAKASK